MDENISKRDVWADVFFADGEEPTVSYRTGMVVYEESLVAGRFVGRGWNGSGYISFIYGRIDPSRHAAPQAFWLEIDGQLLASDWAWGGFEKRTEPSGELHAVVTLRHTVRPVTVAVHTKLDGTAILTRWLEITNTGERPAALGTCGTWSGVLEVMTDWHTYTDASGQALYSLGCFDSSHWAREGDFRWHDLPASGYRIDGRYRRYRHRHPWFILRNNALGTHFIGQLAWSGGYSIEVDQWVEGRNEAVGVSVEESILSFRAGPDAPAPQRVIAPGETTASPEMHLGLTFGDFDTAVQAMHDHLRRSVFLPQARGRGSWVLSAIGPEIEMTPEQVIHSIDCAAEFGAEIFFIDAGWYAPPGGDWGETGDWTPNRDRFPDGIEPFRERVHEKGMLWGLWMEPERFGPNTEIFQRHPDWILRAYDGSEVHGMLNLAIPEVARWMEEQIVRVIEDNGLDFFRLDFNTHGVGRNERDGFVESHFWRYYETLYAIYDRLRARFPDVIFENCAGGGGRTDIGLVRRFCHTWVTDHLRAPRSFSITNGMTMVLPPERISRVYNGSGRLTGEFDFQSRLLLFVLPHFSLFKPPGADWNPHELARLKHLVGLYKEFVRPIMDSGRMYHHTPAVSGMEAQGWGVLEMASRDRTRGICGVFQLSAPLGPEYLLRLRGLDAGRRYRVTFENTGQTCEIDGFVLMKQGITIRLEGALTSELLICEAI